MLGGPDDQATGGPARIETCLAGGATAPAMNYTLTSAQERDRRDPLRAWRDRFILPPGVIYLDGNSLGALPVATSERLDAIVRGQWGGDLIRSWNKHAWIAAPQRVGAKIAGLIGARADEVIVADSTSVNLHKLVAAALRIRPGRRVVLSEPGNFPTDLYIVQGLAADGRCELQLAEPEAIVERLDDQVAVLLLTHVHYKSGRMHDMAALTAAAHAAGALVIWDLSHSVGTVPIALEACNADFAVGCGYKYLNGGPGAPAFLYVAERHHEHVRSPLTGWMGHAAGFAFRDDYEPAAGVARFLCGTPPILALTALEVGVDLIAEIGVEALARKSRDLSESFIGQVMEGCDAELEIISPVDAHERGSHVSFRCPHAYEVCQALIAVGVIGDFRDPDVLRFGFAPAYLGFEDVWRAGEALNNVLKLRLWARDEYRFRMAVT